MSDSRIPPEQLLFLKIAEQFERLPPHGPPVRPIFERVEDETRWVAVEVPVELAASIAILIMLHLAPNNN